MYPYIIHIIYPSPCPYKRVFIPNKGRGASKGFFLAAYLPATLQQPRRAYEQMLEAGQGEGDGRLAPRWEAVLQRETKGKNIDTGIRQSHA